MRWRGPIDPVTEQECPLCTQAKPCSEEHRPLWSALPPTYGPATQCTPPKMKTYLDAIEKGASEKMARQAAGWSNEVFIKWRREVREGRSPAFITKFFEEDIPLARTRLYRKALDAIETGLDQDDEHKAAEIGFKVLEKLYGSELDLPPTSVRHEGSSGGPVEFRIVMDNAPPKEQPSSGVEEASNGEE